MTIDRVQIPWIGDGQGARTPSQSRHVADLPLPAMAPLAPEVSLPAPVLVVEDEPMFHQRLQGVLCQLGYTPEALVMVGSLAAARRHLAIDPVALALVDLGLPDGNGIELIEELRAADPALGILVISAWSTADTLMAALRAGATGYVLKERDDIEVMLSIRSVLRGGAPIDPFVAQRIMAELRPARPAASPVAGDGADVLSAREDQILRLVAEGLGNREIADQLFLSRHTVDCHVKNIYRKLSVNSRVRAVSAARTRGLLD